MKIIGNIMISLRINISNCLMWLAWIIHPSKNRWQLKANARSAIKDRLIYGESFELRTVVDPRLVVIKRPGFEKGSTIP